MTIRMLVWLLVMAATPSIARQATPPTFDHTVPPGQNYDIFSKTT